MEVSPWYMDPNAWNKRRRKCKFYTQGPCEFGNKCIFLHGMKRDDAGSISSTDNSNSNCFGKQSVVVDDRTCGICFDVVLNKRKKKKQRMFGILPNCKHSFCFTCIRKWRKSRQFSFEVTKGCPQCRIVSDFAYPSREWVNTKEEKDQLISDQKSWMLQRDCKYFLNGLGICPFGNACLYRHLSLDGETVDVGPSQPGKSTQKTTVSFTRINELLYNLVNDEFLEEFWSDNRFLHQNSFVNDHDTELLFEHSIPLSDSDMPHFNMPYLPNESEEYFLFEHLLELV